MMGHETSSRGSGRPDHPNLGYIGFAGWVPGGAQMLTAGEAKVATSRAHELINLSSLEVERSADKPASLTAFSRWQSPIWKARTVSLR